MQAQAETAVPAVIMYDRGSSLEGVYASDKPVEGVTVMQPHDGAELSARGTGMSADRVLMSGSEDSLACGAYWR